MCFFFSSQLSYTLQSSCKYSHHRPAVEIQDWYQLRETLIIEGLKFSRLFNPQPYLNLTPPQDSSRDQYIAKEPEYCFYHFTTDRCPYNLNSNQCDCSHILPAIGSKQLKYLFKTIKR